MRIFLNIFTVDLWENFFIDFLDPIKQAPALRIKLTEDDSILTLDQLKECS